MKNEKELIGQELVDFLMARFNMTEDEALQSLAENIGNKKSKFKKAGEQLGFDMRGLK
jgi:hypothetical protein